MVGLESCLLSSHRTYICCITHMISKLLGGIFCNNRSRQCILSLWKDSQMICLERQSCHQHKPTSSYRWPIKLPYQDNIIPSQPTLNKQVMPHMAYTTPLSSWNFNSLWKWDQVYGELDHNTSSFFFDHNHQESRQKKRVGDDTSFILWPILGWTQSIWCYLTITNFTWLIWFIILINPISCKPRKVFISDSFRQ